MITDLTNQIKQIDNANKVSAPKSLETANGHREIKKQLKTDRDEQASNDAAFKSANSSNAGLLLRLQALDQAAAGSGTLQAARWLLFLFFTAIEWVFPSWSRCCSTSGPRPVTRRRSLTPSRLAFSL